MRSTRFALMVLRLLVLAAVFSSCNTTKFLKADEFLLVKNEVKLVRSKGMGNKSKIQYELSTLYRQKPNTNFFFIPREWFFYRTADPGDTSRFDRWVRRVLSEQPTIFDTGMADATVESMKQYMKFQGYYNTKVYYDDNVRKKKISITYYVEPFRQFTIDSVYFSSPDPAVDTILQQIRPETVLEPGAGLEGKLYERERDRITRYMLNHGYAFFLPNYVAPLQADTTVNSQKANLYLEVLPPSGDSLHQLYHIGVVTVFPNYDPLQQESGLRDTFIQGVRFRATDFNLEVKPQTIINNIYLKNGQLYRQEDREKTNRALSGLGVFRFVRLKQEVDTLNPGFINFRIELTNNPKLELGVDFEINYTDRRTAGANAGNLIGLSVSPSVRYRNLFHGAELFISNLSAGVEFNPFPDKSGANPNARFWNTVDLRLQGQLYIPKFLDYLSVWRGLDRALGNRRKQAEGENFYTTLRENAASRVTASYNYLLLLDFYRYNLFNAAYGFDVQRSSTYRYLINHIAIDFLQPFTEPAFQSILDSNPFLQRSFGQQLFVSLLFRDFNVLYNSIPNAKGVSHFAGAHFEIAGGEIWAANTIYNAVASDTTFKLGDVNFSQYIRGEIDLRRYRQLGRNSIAARAILGVALPFGFSDVVPYVKQFFVGGPSSIRAWPARSLGPGGYEDTTYNVSSVRNALLFYQTGDIKLELNLEYRFDIYWRFKGALFLDAGNVWTLNREPNRCGSQFLLRRPSQPCDDETRSYSAPFYQQIAIGTGFGLRFDLTYFLLRLDLGVRLRNPYPLRSQSDGTISEGNYWTDLSRYKLQDVNFNIGLGYPF